MPSTILESYATRVGLLGLIQISWFVDPARNEIIWMYLQYWLPASEAILDAYM